VEVARGDRWGGGGGGIRAGGFERGKRRANLDKMAFSIWQKAGEIE